jgi:hypothetical protein
MLSFATLVMSIQAAVLLATAWLLPHRAVLGAMLVAALVVGLALGHPADFGKSPGGLMLDLGGALGGFVAGWWIVGRRRAADGSVQARRRAASRAPKPGEAAGEGAPSRAGGRRTAVGFALGLVLAAGATAGAWLWTEGALPAQVSAWIAAQGWVPTGTRAATPAPAPGPPSKASAGQRETAALPAGKAGAAKAPTAGAQALPSGEAAHARARAVTERPAGDLRHCLEHGAGADVVRCAEGR